jgi:hypothetical protein
VQKLKSLGHDGDAYDENNRKSLEEIEKQLTPEEQSILKTLKGRRMVRPEDSLNIDNFALDSIDGLAPRLEKGNLGLAATKRAEVKFTAHDPLSFLNGEARAAKKIGADTNGYVQTNGNHMANGNDEVNGHSNAGSNTVKGNLEDFMTAEKMLTNGHVQTNGDHAVNGHGEMNGHSDVATGSGRNGIADLIAVENNSSQPTFDEATRHRLISSLQQSAEELETPYDTVLRFVNAVSRAALGLSLANKRH